MNMETETKQACIFFVDDEAGIRKIVRLTLEEELPCHVTCFDNATSCLKALKEQERRCSLLITDIKMPGMDGLALLSRVRQLRPLLPILIITGHGNVPMAVEALKTGALDFIEKPLDEHVLLPAVEAALKRSANTEDMAGKPLTDSETKILQLIAEGKSNSEMSAFLHRSIRTIERHRYQLMYKLNASSPAELTKVALALGLTSPEII
jgi:two-component system, LuxR family, response regulator FixJ